jgi:predicted amidophosphoribosyltransferase
MMETTDNNDAQNREHMTPTTCPRCRRSMETFPGTPVNFCSECGTPITPDPVRERIVSLMLNGIRDDMRKAVARLEREEPEQYGRLAAIITGEAA